MNISIHDPANPRPTIRSVPQLRPRCAGADDRMSPSCEGVNPNLWTSIIARIPTAKRAPGLGQDVRGDGEIVEGHWLALTAAMMTWIASMAFSTASGSRRRATASIS